MIQWDTDLVQEYDTNILIRCDRPEDYNRTIKFDLSSVVGEQYQAIVRRHPGKKSPRAGQRTRRRTSDWYIFISCLIENNTNDLCTEYIFYIPLLTGPKLWMEIQDGEGPTAPPVLGPVFLGQTLSLVFTLGDDVFNFDSNVLSCWATDGWFLD